MHFLLIVAVAILYVFLCFYVFKLRFLVQIFCFGLNILSYLFVFKNLLLFFAEFLKLFIDASLGTNRAWYFAFFLVLKIESKKHHGSCFLRRKFLFLYLKRVRLQYLFDVFVYFIISIFIYIFTLCLFRFFWRNSWILNSNIILKSLDFQRISLSIKISIGVKNFIKISISLSIGWSLDISWKLINQARLNIIWRIIVKNLLLTQRGKHISFLFIIVHRAIHFFIFFFRKQFFWWFWKAQKSASAVF